MSFGEQAMAVLQQAKQSAKDLANKAFEKGKELFQDVKAAATEVACKGIELLKQGWDNARARSQEAQKKASGTSGWALDLSKLLRSDETSSDGRLGKSDSKSTVLNTTFKKKLVDESLLFYGEEKGNHLHIGRVEANASAGYGYDPKTQTIGLNAKLDGKVSLLQGQLKGTALGKALEGTGKLEVLSAGANLDAGIKLGGKDGFSAKASAGAEATLVKGSLEGKLNLTPKTIYDNTVGRVVGMFAPNSKWTKAPDFLDHGLVLGGSAEAGIGAAAKAEASVGKDEKTGAWGFKAGAKAGAGPMAGLKLFIGVK